MPALRVESRRSRLLVVSAVAAILALVPGSSFAQKREDFGQALQRLAGALAGEGGGTNARVDGALDMVGRTLTLWDASIASHETQSQANIAHAAPPEAAQIRTTLGAIYFERGRLADALTEFSEATRQAPTLQTAWLMRGVTLEAMGRPAEAREAFAASLAARPEEAVAAYHLSRLTPPGDDPAVVLPVVNALLKTAEQLRDAHATARLPFIDVSIIDDRTPARYRFLPAGYGVVIVPLLAARQYDAAYAALRDLIRRDPLRNDPALSSDAFAAAASDIEKGQSESALKRLVAVDEQLRNSSEFHRLRAVAYSAAARPGDALAELETAVRIAPRNERAVVAMLDALLAQGEPLKADAVAVQAQKTLRDSAAVPWIQAQIYSALGRDAEVNGALEKALHAEPLVGIGALWSMLGVFRLRQFDERATDAFRHDVWLNPNRTEAHLLLAESLRSEGRINEAFVEFVAVVLIEPESVRAHLSIGQMQLETGRYPDAIRSLRFVVGKEPTFDSAHHALSNALLRAGHEEEAATELDTFRRLNAETGVADRNQRRLGALQVQAAMLEQTGNCAEAVDVRTRLIELEPAVANHHVELAACLVRLGRYDRAAAALERASSLGAPPVVYRWLADVYVQLGRRQESEQAMRQYEVRQLELLRAQRLAQ